MGRYVYKLPDIGEGIAEAEIVKWHVEPGATIAQDQALVDVMTDKATVEIAAPVSGILRERNGAEGQKLAVGAALAVFETAAAEEEQASPPQAAPDVAVKDAAAARTGGAKVRAAPAVRQRARALGLDLSALRVIPYGASPIFDEQSLPDALRNDHRTKAGTWGLLRVLDGEVRLIFVIERWIDM